MGVNDHILAKNLSILDEIGHCSAAKGLRPFKISTICRLVVKPFLKKSLRPFKISTICRWKTPSVETKGLRPFKISTICRYNLFFV